MKIESRRVGLLMAIALFCTTFSISAQKVAIKTNLLYAATTSPNLQLEMSLGPKSTFELGGSVNIFEYGNNRKIKHILVQPEYRFWFYEKFNGGFMALHLNGAQFNVGQIRNHRYEGYLYGAGIGYGYQWILSKRWNLEANVGAGYAHVNYEKFSGEKLGASLNKNTYNYFGITKAGVSLIYFFK